SSRYLAQRRARLTPPSKTGRDSSRGGLPASSRATICSRRWRASSNVMSLISPPDRLHAPAQRSPGAQPPHRPARTDVDGASQHGARFAPGEAIPPPEHRERRQALQPPDESREAMIRGLHGLSAGGGQPATKLGEHGNALGNPSQGMEGTQGICPERH